MRALHSYQNILSGKKQWTFLRRQEVLLSPYDKLSRVVANLGDSGRGAGGQSVWAPADGALDWHTEAVERAIGCDVNKPVKSCLHSQKVNI